MRDVDQALPEVVIKLGEKEHRIKCSFGVLRRFQEMIGPERDALKIDTFRSMSVDDYVKFLACCIYSDKADPAKDHLDEIAEQMGSKHLTEILQIVQKLLYVSEPEPEKKADSPVVATTEKSEPLPG